MLTLVERCKSARKLDSATNLECFGRLGGFVKWKKNGWNIRGTYRGGIRV